MDEDDLEDLWRDY